MCCGQNELTERGLEADGHGVARQERKRRRRRRRRRLSYSVEILSIIPG
jgi:hypothetical protein